MYCVSTTDKEAILEVAKKEKVDVAVGYVSDPAAPTAAYVAEKLSLPINQYRSVKRLANTEKSRESVRLNNFSCQKANSFSSIESAK